MGTNIVAIKKADEDQRLVFAEIYAPLRPDSDGEFMDAPGIREMSYRFMKSMKLDSVDSFHNNEIIPGCCVIESFIARKGDPDFIEGSWVVGMHVDDADTWDKIKKGEINGFSMEAMVSKEQVDVTLTIPPILQGKTMKAEDGHVHTFYVAYDESGRFLGGKTDAESGHYHIIKRGSVTEPSNDHSHRFSHVDDLVLTEKA